MSASRARERVTVYTDDKGALLDAVSRSDERLSATERVRDAQQREVVALQQRIADIAKDRQEQEREQLVHER